MSSGEPAPSLHELQREAQAEGRRAVVGAVVINREGRAFVHRRGPDRNFLPNGWDVLGGHVEAGETLLEALAREVEEESGWRLTGTPRLIFMADWETIDHGRPNRRREFDFLVEVEGDLDHPRLEWPLHTEYRWVGLEDLDVLDENAGRDDGIVRHVVEMGLRDRAANGVNP
jgi:8-oxo-dGTP pyrophosphatase MutT (NUDIX family)